MNGIPKKRAQTRKGKGQASPVHLPARRSPSPSLSQLDTTGTIRLPEASISLSDLEQEDDLGGATVAVTHRTGKRAPASPPPGLFLIHMPGGGEEGEGRRGTPPASTSRHQMSQGTVPGGDKRTQGLSPGGDRTTQRTVPGGDGVDGDKPPPLPPRNSPPKILHSKKLDKFPDTQQKPPGKSPPKSGEKPPPLSTSTKSRTKSAKSSSRSPPKSPVKSPARKSLSSPARNPHSSPGSPGKKKISVADPCDSSSDSESGEAGGRESWMCREFQEDDDEEDEEEDELRDSRSSYTYEDIDDVLESGRDIKRRQVAQEMLDTEDTHVNVLFNLTKAIWKLDGANKKSPYIKESEFKRILPDIDPLYKVHSEHIRPEFAKQLDEWSESSGIAIAFLAIEPMLKMYRSYVPTMCLAANKLTEFRKTCIPISNLLSIIEDDPGFGKLPIQAHMSSLFQRLLRYRLLLQKYIRHTVAKSEEAKLSQDALQRIESIIESIEKDMKHKENFMAIFRIQGQLENDYAIYDSERELIKEGEVTKIAARTGSKELPRYLFLFNDIMLLCNPRNSRGKYVVKAQLDVNGLKLRDALHLKRTDIQIDRTILLKARQSALTLMFRSISERDSWERAFIRALGKDITENQLFMNTVTLGNAAQRMPTNFKAAPTWIPDNSTDCCMLCAAKFSAIRRKHHCRACGIVVDSRCLKHKIRLPFSNHEEKKVCDECYRHARAKFPALVRHDASMPSDDYT